VADARALETAPRIDAVVLDKTGTVTEGEFTLLETAGDLSRMAELAAVEACSEHPIGRAISVGRTSWSALRESETETKAAQQARATDVAVHKGMGIGGVVNGVRYFLGNRAFTDTATGGASAGASLPSLRSTAGTLVYFGWDNAVRGALLFGDRIRPEAAGLCAALRQRGIRTILLSGDGRATTQNAAKSIGADEWIAEAAPDRKIEAIRELQQRGLVVAMIGDGVNDAPSLAQADLGIAMGTGADIAIQAAPLILMNRSLGTAIDILDLSRRTFRIVRQNLFWAFAYNIIGISLAMAGRINPILAAAAMVLSSVSVIGNSRRL